VIYARGNWAEREYCLTSFDPQLTDFGPVLLPRLRRDLSTNPATCFPMTSNEVWKHIATGAAGTRQIARADPFIRAAARFTMDEIKPALLQPPGVIAIRARRM
jgi:hypothetical protein